MNKKQIINLAVCISISIFCLSFRNTKQSIVSVSLVDIGQYINELQSNDPNEREKASKTIQEYHEQLIENLIKLVNVKLEDIPSLEAQKTEYGKYHAKELAIDLLGESRSVKAVPVLMENLEYRNPFDLYAGSNRSLGSQFPAARALAKIGMPSVEPALDRLRDYEKYKMESGICCWTLRAVLGNKLAQAHIQITIDETKDEKANKNLNDALNYIKTFTGKAG